jgi:hypothetical protein
LKWRGLARATPPTTVHSMAAHTRRNIKRSISDVASHEGKCCVGNETRVHARGHKQARGLSIERRHEPLCSPADTLSMNESHVAFIASPAVAANSIVGITTAANQPR